MSIVKSFSVGNGDTFYINHGSDNFTVIDCNLRDSDDNKDDILNELSDLSSKKGITRFISTHPDEDHYCGIKDLDDRIKILNFYCVENEATKTDESESFKHYKSLRDSDKAFYIYKECSRRWMNSSDEDRGSAGISILWPKADHDEFKNALEEAKEGKAYNNLSAVIRYSYGNGVSYLWMGDLETGFMEKIEEDIDLIETSILFAPHHGRESGKVPKSMLEKLAPKIIVIGEALSKDLNYYDGYNTITQNSAGEIIFENNDTYIHIFTSKNYSVDFLEDLSKSKTDFYYLGSQKV